MLKQMILCGTMIISGTFGASVAHSSENPGAVLTPMQNEKSENSTQIGGD